MSLHTGSDASDSAPSNDSPDDLVPSAFFFNACLLASFLRNALVLLHVL